MENMQKIQDYIAKNQIKSSFIGGYNKAEVHKLLNTVLEMFEAELKEQQEKAEKREAEFLAGLDDTLDYVKEHKPDYFSSEQK